MATTYVSDGIWELMIYTFIDHIITTDEASKAAKSSR